MAAAIVFLALTALLAVFQLALALGAPLGHFAWGGQHRVLPQHLRRGSLVSIGLYAVFALVIAMRAGLVSSWPSIGWIVPAAWVLVAYLVLGTVMNAISRSRPERLVMTPVVLVLLACALVVALG